MTNQESLIEEFKEVRSRYYYLLSEIIKQKIPGVVIPEAITCNSGTQCHGGGLLSELEKSNISQ